MPGLSPLIRHKASVKRTPPVQLITAQLTGTSVLVQIFGLHIDKILYQNAALSGS